MELMGKILTPCPKKLAGHEVNSVRSRVVNLESLNPRMKCFNTALIQNAGKYFGDFEREYDLSDTFHQSSLKLNLNDRDVMEQIEELKNPAFIFGMTPDFTHHLENRFSWGSIEILFFVEKGKIVRSTIYSDSLAPEWIEYVKFTLKNVISTQSVDVDQRPCEVGQRPCEVDQRLYDAQKIVTQLRSHEKIIDGSLGLLPIHAEEFLQWLQKNLHL